MQLFICGYGLSVFLETPKEARKGRAVYLAISWIIFLLFSLSQAGDAYQIFDILYHAEKDNPMDILRLRHRQDSVWWRVAASVCLFVVNWIADGLLVSTVNYVLIQSIEKGQGLPMLYRLDRAEMGLYPASSGVSILNR